MYGLALRHLKEEGGRAGGTKRTSGHRTALDWAAYLGEGSLISILAFFRSAKRFAI